MDDVRGPSPQRRDFAQRHRPYSARPPVTDLRPAARPIPRPTTTYNPVPSQPQPVVYSEPATPPQPYSPPEESNYAHYTPPVAAATPKKTARRNPFKALPAKYVLSGVVIIALIATAAFMLTRPPKKSGFTVAQLAKKADFGFFYPQPLPNGYTYEPKFNAVQGGQVYFMLVKGTKHMVFREQPANGSLDINGLNGVRKITTAAGPAAVGSQAGQPAAKVLAGSTLISVNSTGSVAESDLLKVLDLLKISH